MDKILESDHPIAASHSAITVDLSTYHLLEGHAFYFRAVYFDEAIHLTYLVCPPISASNHYANEEERYWICGEVVDDIGTEYMYKGGAYGLWKIAPCTDGIMSFGPLPHKNAEILSFKIGVLKGETENEFRFSLLLR